MSAYEEAAKTIAVKLPTPLAAAWGTEILDALLSSGVLPRLLEERGMLERVGAADAQDKLVSLRYPWVTTPNDLEFVHPLYVLHKEGTE